MAFEELRYLAVGERASVKFRCGEKEFSLSPKLSFVVDEKTGTADFKATGYVLSCDGTETEAASFEEIVKWFSGEAEITDINDKYKSTEEYEKAKAFESISMEELLEMELPLADGFSLTCPYNSGYDAEHPYGLYKISEELSAEAIRSLRSFEYCSAKRQYENISAEDKEKLPPFSKLYEDIADECFAYRKKNPKTAEKFGGNAFFADEFARGKTEYKKPQQLWHIYHAVDFVETCRFQLDKMKHNAKERAIDCELDSEEYKQLKSSLLKTEVTFCWHCTTSGLLSKVFYFKLDDNSVNWLKKLKDDYDLKLLEDLAFYNGEELIFSSCTHERFHTQIKR